MDNKTKLFYVVDAPEVNEELFTTREEAQKHADSLHNGRVRICEVHNAYYDGGGWNYDDYANTFNTVVTLS